MTNSLLLKQFAATVGAGIGTAVLVAGWTRRLGGVHAEASIYVGATLAFASAAAFVLLAHRESQNPGRMVVRSGAAMALGLACVWFWLVPVRGAVLLVACTQGHNGACSTVAEYGGIPAAVARSNSEFVEERCLLAGDPAYCRLAAARKIVHPRRFCPRISLDEAFEVVEWCTSSPQTGELIARR